MSLDRMTKLSWIYDLYHLGQNVQQGGDTAAVYQQILQHIVGGFDAKNGSLALQDSVSDSLTIVAGIDLPPSAIGSRIKMGEGVLGWVVKEGKALRLNGDVSSDPRFQMRSKDGRKHAPTNSSICWPLQIESRIIGGISVNRPEGMPPFSDTELEQGTVLLNMVSLALGNIQLHLEQTRQLAALQQANTQLEEAQSHLLQSEKMASIGQLAAGVAHEINNPIGYVYSNLGTLEKYVQDLFAMLGDYEQAESAIADAAVKSRLQSARQKLDIGFLKDDLRALMDESKDGITRVKNIVQNLKDFSHVDAADEWQYADLHAGLNSTLNIVNNEIKYKAEVVKEYGDIPQVECLPSQLNQVFMNLLVNASHAIEERGLITVRTGQSGEEAWVEVEDTGKGIVPENLQKIFDPFFTTKPIGKGTGLGLSLSYGIVQKHNGRIEVQSEVGKGTKFRVWLPLRHEQKE